MLMAVKAVLNREGESMEGTGTVGKVFENESRKGDRYWGVVIDNVRYSVFEKAVRDALAEGAAVEFTWAQKGKYRTITRAQPLAKVAQAGNGASAPAPSPVEAHVSPVERETRIIRQTCVKAAAEIIAAMCLPTEKAGPETLGLAKRFEAWILQREPA